MASEAREGRARTYLISEKGLGHPDKGMMQLAHLVSFLFINFYSFKHN